MVCHFHNFLYAYVQETTSISLPIWTGVNVRITKIEMIYPQEGALIGGEQVPCIEIETIGG